MFQHPLKLGCGEIGIDAQAGLFKNHGLEALVAQTGTERFGATILPDDGVTQWLASIATPQHSRLALVGYAQGGNVLESDSRLPDCFARGADLRFPDVDRVVFDPACLGKYLPGFMLGAGDDAAFDVEDDAARTGGALIQCE